MKKAPANLTNLGIKIMEQNQTQALNANNYVKVTRHTKGGGKTTYLRKLTKGGETNYQHVYKILAEYHPATCKEIESLCEIAVANVSSVLSMLEHNGYVITAGRSANGSRKYAPSEKLFTGQKLPKAKKAPSPTLPPSPQVELFPAAPITGTLPNGVAVAVPRPEVQQSLVEVKVQRSFYIMGKEISEAQARHIIEQLSNSLGG
jgi:hypothetical protein